MLDLRRMDRLKLRFPEHHHPEMPLMGGVHAFGRLGDTVGLVDESDAPLIRLFVDRRGVWMTVTEGARGVHVNGRPVQRMAMLRLGDSIYLDGVEMVLMSERSTEPLPDALRHMPGEFRGDPRVVVRGVGGQHHGRSFTLDAPRLIGRSDDADIRIDDPAFAERHARIEMIGERIILRDLGAGEGSVVNGEPMRDALLAPGDQIVFDTHHRFVIEAPAQTTAQLARSKASNDDAAVPEIATTRRPRNRHLPWLLLAAASIAAVLAGLLAWGGG
jgi:Inner membrane component of T3SS, cytoplasmic domain